jgi:5'-methylthioadenosine phosphorylase
MGLRVGVIGGSGLYEMEGMTDAQEVKVETPFGDPSDAFVIGTVGDVELVFLSRHGCGHRFNPSEVPYRANLFGMKKLGVSWVISVSAVGSLRAEIAPRDVVLIDQFIDRTKGRPATFFEKGIVGHVGFGDPICETLRGFLLASAREAAVETGVTVHDRGTYVCMEGPAFSTRAESNLYRSWEASVIGMTNLPEAKLAREAGMSYATLAMATDYDCWHEGHEDVTVETVISHVVANVKLAKAAIAKAIPRIADFNADSPHAMALAGAIMTHPDRIPADRRAALAPLIGDLLG